MLFYHILNRKATKLYDMYDFSPLSVVYFAQLPFRLQFSKHGGLILQDLGHILFYPTF